MIGTVWLMFGGVPTKLHVYVIYRVKKQKTMDFSQFPKPKSSTITKVTPLIAQMGSTVEARLSFLRRVSMHMIDEGPDSDQAVMIPDMRTMEDGVLVVCTLANRVVTQPNVLQYVQQVIDAINLANASLERARPVEGKFPASFFLDPPPQAVIPPSPEPQRPTLAMNSLDIQAAIQSSVERMLRPIVEELGKARMIKCGSCGGFHPANVTCTCATPVKKKTSGKRFVPAPAPAENVVVPSMSSRDSGEESQSEEADDPHPVRRSKSVASAGVAYRPFKSITVVTTPSLWISLLQDGAELESLGKELEARYVESKEMNSHHVLKKNNADAIQHILSLLSTMSQLGSWDSDLEVLENMHLECEMRFVHATTGSAEIAEDFRRIVRDEKINPLLKKGWKKVRESMKVKGTTSAGRNVSVPQMPQAEYEKLSAASKEAVNKHLKSIRDSLKA